MKRVGGKWRITDRGLGFLLGKLFAPKFCEVWHGRRTRYYEGQDNEEAIYVRVEDLLPLWDRRDFAVAAEQMREIDKIERSGQGLLFEG
jgi:hypothetical protein